MARSTPRRGTRHSAPRDVTELAARQRLQSIAEAAYFRALARGFTPDGALQDWLDAEAEYDAAQAVQPHRHASSQR